LTKFQLPLLLSQVGFDTAGKSAAGKMSRLLGECFNEPYSIWTGELAQETANKSCVREDNAGHGFANHDRETLDTKSFCPFSDSRRGFGITRGLIGFFEIFNFKGIFHCCMRWSLRSHGQHPLFDQWVVSSNTTPRPNSEEFHLWVFRPALQFQELTTSFCRHFRRTPPP
jgi:hypothetical protein